MTIVILGAALSMSKMVRDPMPTLHPSAPSEGAAPVTDLGRGVSPESNANAIVHRGGRASLKPPPMTPSISIVASHAVVDHRKKKRHALVPPRREVGQGVTPLRPRRPGRHRAITALRTRIHWTRAVQRPWYRVGRSPDVAAG